MPSALAQADDAAALAGVVRDPVRFCCGLLRQDLWPLQEAILRAVASRSRVAVKACHASGKTFVAAVAVLWLVTRYRDGIVVTTAPTWTQVEKLLRGGDSPGVEGVPGPVPDEHRPFLHSSVPMARPRDSRELRAPRRARQRSAVTACCNVRNLSSAAPTCSGNTNSEMTATVFVINAFTRSTWT